MILLISACLARKEICFWCICDKRTFHSFIHSFIGMCRLRWFLALHRNFFHSSLLRTFSCHPSQPTVLPSSLTSSCHLFLGLPLSLLVLKFIYNTLLGNSTWFCKYTYLCPKIVLVFICISDIIIEENVTQNGIKAALHILEDEHLRTIYV